MSIASEITRLQNAKADIKAAIESKGVEVPSSAKLDSFDTYIENISGSGEPIHTFAQLNEKAKEFVDYLLDIPSTYTSSSSEPITLYTPDETCKKYIIAKKPNGYYRAYWIKTNTGVVSSVVSTYYQMKSWYLNVSQVGLTDLTSFDNAIIPGNYVPSGYSTGDLYTVQACLDALKSSQTSYTRITEYPKLDGQKDIPYSNTFVYDSALDELIIPQKISSNEIIQTL